MYLKGIEYPNNNIYNIWWTSIYKCRNCYKNISILNGK